MLLTRARRGLIVVGHQNTLSSDTIWRHWVLHAASQRVMAGSCQPVSSMVAEQAISPDAADKELAGGPGRWMSFAPAWPKAAAQPVQPGVTGGPVQPGALQPGVLQPGPQAQQGWATSSVYYLAASNVLASHNIYLFVYIFID